MTSSEPGFWKPLMGIINIIPHQRELFLYVLGPPHGQMRARATAAGRYARVYKHQKQKQAEQSLLAQIVTQLPNDHKPLAGPLGLMLTFLLPRPKSHYGTGCNSGDIKKSAPTYPVVTPDLDNLEKHVLDACNNIVWKDDRQLVFNFSIKAYANGSPRTEIEIFSLL